MGNSESSRKPGMSPVVLGFKNFSPYGSRDDDKANEKSDWKPSLPSEEEKKEKESFVFTPKPLPLDENGYIKSFTCDQSEEIHNFFEEYGVVVVRELLTNEEIEKSKNEVWEKIVKECPWVDREDASTWLSWPWGFHLGILGSDPILTPQAFANRQNPSIYKVFNAIFGESKLYVSVDRIGMMRPTKYLKWPTSQLPKKFNFSDDENSLIDQSEEISNEIQEKLEKVKQREFVLIDKPDWKTQVNWLHLDMNPYTGRTSTFAWGPNVRDNYDYSLDNPTLKVQGILSFVDHTERDGGFHCVPGFHHFINDWEKANRSHCKKSYEGMDPTTVQIPQDDPIRQHIQRISLRPGSICIWNSKIPHGTFPNDSHKFRMIQYLKMGLSSDPSISESCKWVNDNQLNEYDFKILSNVSITPLGERLLGLTPWE